MKRRFKLILGEGRGGPTSKTCDNHDSRAAMYRAAVPGTDPVELQMLCVRCAAMARANDRRAIIRKAFR